MMWGRDGAERDVILDGTRWDKRRGETRGGSQGVLTCQRRRMWVSRGCRVPQDQRCRTGSCRLRTTKTRDAFGRDRSLTPTRTVTGHEWRGCQQRPKPHEDGQRCCTRTYLTEATACERGHDERGVDAGRPLPRCEDQKREWERGCRRGSTSAEVRTTGQESALGAKNMAGARGMGCRGTWCQGRRRRLSDDERGRSRT